MSAFFFQFFFHNLTMFKSIQLEYRSFVFRFYFSALYFTIIKSCQNTLKLYNVPYLKEFMDLIDIETTS